jgi:hypothetical protein
MLLLPINLLLVLALIFPLTVTAAVNGKNYSENFGPNADCPFLPSSETAQPLPVMKCHDPLCLSYFGNYSLSEKRNEELEKRCWLPAENRSLGSLFVNSSK